MDGTGGDGYAQLSYADQAPIQQPERLRVNGESGVREKKSRHHLKNRHTRRRRMARRTPPPRWRCSLSPPPSALPFKLYPSGVSRLPRRVQICPLFVRALL